MLIYAPPKGWHELQELVAQILRECGIAVEIDKQLKTARGKVNVDVFGNDRTRNPETTLICECKYWKQRVPKTVIHSFRSVVSDFGANLGIIISSEGFQRGAFEAAKNSNIRLVTWEEFQDLFTERWYSTFLKPQIEKEADPLVEYTEPINTRIFRKADALDKAARDKFIQLRSQYGDLAFLTVPLYVRFAPLDGVLLDLPLKKSLGKAGKETTYKIPSDLLEQTTLRGFLEVLKSHLRKAIAEFDAVFGERA